MLLYHGASFRKSDHATPEDIMAQPIWLNDMIKIDNKYVFKQTWISNGIFFINDLIDEHGTFYNQQTVCEKYNLNINFLEYYGLIAAIPPDWKNKLRDCNKMENISSKHLTYMRENRKVTKYFTNILIEMLKYLYNCKCNYRLPTFEQAISYVKYYKTIELHSCIYYSATKARKVKDKWEIISHAFQL